MCGFVKNNAERIKNFSSLIIKAIRESIFEWRFLSDLLEEHRSFAMAVFPLTLFSTSYFHLESEHDFHLAALFSHTLCSLDAGKHHIARSSHFTYWVLCWIPRYPFSHHMKSTLSSAVMSLLYFTVKYECHINLTTAESHFELPFTAKYHYF